MMFSLLFGLFFWCFFLFTLDLWFFSNVVVFFLFSWLMMSLLFFSGLLTFCFFSDVMMLFFFSSMVRLLLLSWVIWLIFFHVCFSFLFIVVMNWFFMFRFFMMMIIRFRDNFSLFLWSFVGDLFLSFSLSLCFNLSLFSLSFWLFSSCFTLFKLFGFLFFRFSISLLLIFVIMLSVWTSEVSWSTTNTSPFFN